MISLPFKAALAGVLAAAAVSATPVLAADGACFTTSEILSTARVGAREITVRTRDNRYFRVVTKNDCRSSSLPDPLVFNTGASSGLICKPVDVTLSSGVQPNTACLVESVTRISAEEAAARPSAP